MDNKFKVIPSTIIQQQQQETLPKQGNNENFSQPAASKTPPPLPLSPEPQPPKVTVLLPKHAASKLRDLVQKRDIALLKLGIISVQFEDDQIIPLSYKKTDSDESTNHHEQQQTIAPIEPSIECNPDVDCLSALDTTIANLTGLTPSPNHHGTIIEEDEELDNANMNWSMFDLI